MPTSVLKIKPLFILCSTCLLNNEGSLVYIPSSDWIVGE